MTPSPFEISRAIGNNLSAGFREQKEKSAIDEILTSAMNSEDPNAYQQTIGKILSHVRPENQSKVFDILNHHTKQLTEQKEKKLKLQAAQEGGYNAYAPPGVQAQQVRNQVPAKPAGGLSGQPVPSDIAQKTADVLAENGTANADELALAFDRAGVPRANSNSYIENRRRQDENKPGSKYSQNRENAISDYVNEAFSQGGEAENLVYTFDIAEKAIKGNIAGPGLEAIAKNNPYAQLYIGLTPDEATLQAANKTLLGSSKGIFGSKPTEREIFLLLNSMLPAIGKTPEANIAGLDYIKRINEMKIKRAEIVDELTDGGKKYVADLERKVNAKMNPLAEKLKDDLKKSVELLSNQPNSSAAGKQPNQRPGFVQMKDPRGIERWVPENIANQLGK